MHTSTAALTATQSAALLSMLRSLSGAMDRSFFTAYQVDVSASTLTFLVAHGLVERRWAQSSLRGGERWGYRLTHRGYNAARRLQAAL